MPSEPIPWAEILPRAMAFAMLVCRTAAIFVFLPIPGFQRSASTPRLLLSVLLAGLLTPWVPAMPANLPLGELVRIAALEAALGAGLGLCVALAGEGIQLAAQMIGLSAGFSYASTIDPASEADSAIVQVLLNLTYAQLFLAIGADTLLFRYLLSGTIHLPPGEWVLAAPHGEAILALLPEVTKDAVRLALPVVGILLLFDLALALASRIQPQLQLLTLSFPVKMLAAVVLLVAGAGLLVPHTEAALARSLSAVHLLLEAHR